MWHQALVACSIEQRQALRGYDREIRVKSWPELQKKSVSWVIIVMKLLFSHRTAQWKLSLFSQREIAVPLRGRKEYPSK